MIIYFISVIVLGIFVGLVSGMFGLGGGGIIVPALLPLLPLIGMPQSKLMFMAMGTAFGTMIISTGATAYNHFRQKNIGFTSLKLFLPLLLLTVLLSSQIVTNLNQNFLKLFFALFLIYFGFKMLRQSQRTTALAQAEDRFTKTKTIFAALGIGLISTLGGVSGAGLIVPYLTKTGLPIKKAIGTASFCGFFLTLFASFGFMLNGLNDPNLPAYSFGFIHLPTVALISLLSVPMSKVGVKLMLKIPDQKIKKYFALFLISLSLYMLVMAINSLLKLYL